MDNIASGSSTRTPALSTCAEDAAEGQEIEAQHGSSQPRYDHDVLLSILDRQRHQLAVLSARSQALHLENQQLLEHITVPKECAGTNTTPPLHPLALDPPSPTATLNDDTESIASCASTASLMAAALREAQLLREMAGRQGTAVALHTPNASFAHHTSFVGNNSFGGVSFMTAECEPSPPPTAALGGVVSPAAPRRRREARGHHTLSETPVSPGGLPVGARNPPVYPTRANTGPWRWAGNGALPAMTLKEGSENGVEEAGYEKLRVAGEEERGVEEEW
eukprot:Sspe_Gene.102089::Locus_76853_Transcript_1_1_Confidence_1.000_Length_932::g.102089::m.102089